MSGNPSPNTTPPPPGGASSTAMKIGNAFIKQYYKILLTSPSQLNRFYQPDSTVSRGMEPSSPATQSPFSLATTSMNGSDDSPGERVRKAFFEWAGAGLTDEHDDDECTRVDFEHGAIDAQESINGGIINILLVVTGHMFLPGKVKSLHFVHTFFLNNNSPPGMKKQFLVKNDILRFLEPVDVEEEEEEEEDIEEQVSFQIEDSPPIAVAEMGAPRGIAEEPAVVLTGRDEFGPFAHNLLEKGQNHTTLRLANDNQLPLVPPTALSIVLNFLKRCEDETFVEVMDSVRLKDEAFMGFRGACCGDLVTPSTWINILLKASSGSSKPSSILQIAANISPLLRCMCNDTERLFFKSNKHWKEGSLPFVDLIGKMFSTSIGSTYDERGTDKKLVDALLTHEGLLSSIVQWGFWGDRPDIVKEVGADACARVVNIGRNTIRILVIDAVSSTISENDRDLLKSIGTTPIVSKDYDPNCMVSFVLGLIRDQKNRITLNPNVTLVLEPLMGGADCIDKDVIMEMVDLGMNHVHDYESAVVVARLSGFILCQELNFEQGIESDTRAAFAIRSGLIEMCLNFVDRFGGHEAFGGDDDEAENSLLDLIRYIFYVVHGASLHKKTWKAIKHKTVDIGEKLLHSKEIIDNANKPTCNEILDMVASILNLNGRYCCHCNKPLSRTEVKECNGCHHMAYCSRACQKEDWQNGHSVTCCMTYTPENVGQFQGRVEPKEVPVNERDIAKLKGVERNQTMIQLKLLLDSSETILNQAKALGLHLSDCVVSFDLRYCPPTIEVKKYTYWFNEPELKKAFEESRSKENITCVYFSSIFYGELDENGYNPRLVMKRFFPHERLKQS